MALTWLGAIPALMNPNIPGDIAAEYIRRLRGVGADHRRRAPGTPGGGEDIGVPFLGDAAEIGTGDPAKAPAHYRHHADDPIAITHSSGTTRMPTARRALARQPVRRDPPDPAVGPRAQGTDRILSALPAAARGRHHDPEPGPVQPVRAAVPVRAERRRRGAGRDRALAADRRLRLRGHLGRAGPLRPERVRPGLGVALVQHRRLRARGAHPPPGRRRPPQRRDPRGRQPGARLQVRRRHRLDRDGPLRVPHHAHHRHRPLRPLRRPAARLRRGRAARPGHRRARCRSARSATSG